MLRSLLLAECLSVAVFAQDSPPLQGAALHIVEGYALVDVSINGSGPFRMLIDTGATSCSLTPKAAVRAGLIYDHRAVVSTVAAERVVPASSNNHIQVGTARETGVEIMVLDLPASTKVDSKVVGVLGQSFLSRSSYLIDYHQKRLWLRGEATGRSDGLPIAVNAVEADGRMVLPVVLKPGTDPWNLVLDSGASSLLLLCGERCPRLNELEPGTAVTDAGECPVQRGRLKRIEVGASTVLAGDAFIMRTAQTGHQDGLLPARWFSAIYVDSTRRFVRLAQHKSGY